MHLTRFKARKQSSLGFLTMLSNVGLLKELWDEAVNLVCYFVNRPPLILINFMTPKDVWFGSFLIMQI